MVTFSVNKKESGKNYLERAGAYGFIINKDGLLATVQTKTGYFLPGGGIEAGESEEECLKRECLEEIGMEISIKSKFAIGTYHFHSTTADRDMTSVGHFFDCAMESMTDSQSEPGHRLAWLAPSDATKSLYLENQNEAVKIYLKKFK